MAIINDIPTESELLEEDLIESRIGVHDSNHFEVKLDYTIGSQGRSEYRVDCYFFVPSSLGVNEHTYKSDQFYSDVQAYIRFKTPVVPLAALASEADSPVHVIEELAASLRRSPRDTDLREELSYELRMFGCIVRANIRDRVRGLREKLAAGRNGTQVNMVLLNDAATIGLTLVCEIEKCLSLWRELRPNFVDGRLPRSCNETYGLVDEYLSRVVEVKLASVIRRIDSINEPTEPLIEARSRSKDLLLNERHYRKDAGYSSVQSEYQDDHFVYRQGLLKKFVMSVLWLQIRKEKDGKNVANVGAAIAAGAAMFFALLATIFAGNHYGMNSWNFIIAGVFTYILKDRIKDGLKIFFGERFSRFLADYSMKIRDPISRQSIGRCRESFCYLRPSQVPKDVLDYRYKDKKISIESMAKPEVVLHYGKEVRLRGKELIDRMHLEHYDINDIVRFSLWQFLVRADDPTSSIPYFAEDSDSVERRDFRKVYHLNLVMVLASKTSGRSELKRVRVIFDKNAIRELQEVA